MAKKLACVYKRTGNFYCHCNWHASHYVKGLPDQISGKKIETERLLHDGNAL